MRHSFFPAAASPVSQQLLSKTAVWWTTKKRISVILHPCSPGAEGRDTLNHSQNETIAGCFSTIISVEWLTRWEEFNLPAEDIKGKSRLQAKQQQNSQSWELICVVKSSTQGHSRRRLTANTEVLFPADIYLCLEIPTWRGEYKQEKFTLAPLCKCNLSAPAR